MNGSGEERGRNVHQRRAEWLRRLGLPDRHAGLLADVVDWLAVADLGRLWLALTLALRIIR